MENNNISANNKGLYMLLLVAALGYFVDVYDLVLFGVVRVDSLKGLGITDDLSIKTMGESLFNFQMIGMLIGGILWGILGDKKGRLSVLFGSIIMYSLANILNAYITNVEQYKILRFIAGIGLAGELGAGVTLVSETMSKEKRGLGTMLVASFGVMGAVVASLLASKFDWRTSYLIGGVMGIVLLVLRIGVHESHMYKSVIQNTSIQKGNFLQLFSNKKLFKKYLTILIVGIPIWFTINVFIIFSKEMGQALHMTEVPLPKYAILFNYIGLCVGDILSGTLSHLIKSRKKAILIFLLLNISAIILYLTYGKTGLTPFYICCGYIGFSVGYWAVFITSAAEQFGTNIRSTVATTAPNMVRGAVYLVNIVVGYFASIFGGHLNGVLVSCLLFIGSSLIALYFLEETYGKELDYTE
jgi:MFS family permease